MKRSYWLVLGVVAMAVVLGSATARADTFGTLTFGSVNPGTSGGSFDDSYWKPNTGPNAGVNQKLDFLYCLALYDYISAPSNNSLYNDTRATSNGTVERTRAAGVGNELGQVSYNSLTDTSIAGAIAWILDTNENVATSNDTEKVVQQAIWDVIYGASYTPTAAGAATLASNALINSGSGNIGNYLWFTPNPGNYAINQPQVGRVPDGGVTLMLLGGALAGLETLRRKLRA